MIVDRWLLHLYRRRRRFNAGARVHHIQDGSGRIWPAYHTRAYPETGVGGVPVVFFHGFGNDAWTWFHLFTMLGTNRELVAVDLPGFGKHLPREGDLYTPGWYAEQCSNLVRELAVRWGQPPILVGKSMGAMIAGLVAEQIPDLCRALVLIAPGGVKGARISPFWEEYQQGRNVLLPRDESEWDRMMEYLYHRKRTVPGFMRRESLQALREARPFLETVFERLLEEGFDPLGQRLPRITCPVSLVWGARDRIMDPSALKRFRAELPRSPHQPEAVLLPECGHSPTTEAPLETRRILLKVFSRFG